MSQRGFLRQFDLKRRALGLGALIGAGFFLLPKAWPGPPPSTFFGSPSSGHASGPGPSGGYPAPSCGGPASCAAGMTLIGTAGSREAFCIDNANSGATTTVNTAVAAANCKNANKHLCTQKEWFSACAISGGALSMGAIYEVITTQAPPTDASSVQAGGTGCASIQWTNATAAPYRCCTR